MIMKLAKMSSPTIGLAASIRSQLNSPSTIANIVSNESSTVENEYLPPHSIA